MVAIAQGKVSNRSGQSQACSLAASSASALDALRLARALGVGPGNWPLFWAAGDEPGVLPAEGACDDGQ